MDGCASSPREPDGPDGADGTTLPPRKRGCRARRTAGARGVQAVGSNESAARVGEVLQDFGKESEGREDLGVGLEEVRIRRAVDDGVRASFVEEQVL